MLSDLEKAYDYLQTHNLVDTFVCNYQNASRDFLAMRTNSHPSFIRRAFAWSSTPEGQTFWDDHDEAILRLHIYLSATDVFNYIESHSTTVNQPYEFW